ncbi:peroxisomal biogenesis factor 11-domain-containing protein [Plectosphaerella plurivora]|uniref:Peroxisomal biogenesis factor 11-domain-containing protein n=1 Tax=Plectosphaerella plurivora TaxID=936078 RepID=A0A9P9AAC0_9PEZI|nr:peroxisomal biogenesis factor 11-domain-containing protein [Plectosphaerella plurivora]
MSRTFEQAHAFGTDLFGLERFLRGVHSCLIILQSYPPLLALIAPLFTIPAASVKPAYAVIAPLKDQVNITRRYIRTFKFIDSYALAYGLVTGAAGPKSLETYLDIFYGTFMGTFGMLETITLPDISGVPGLSIFGREKTIYLNIEAQRLWLFGLVCSVLSNGIKLIKLFALAPVPSGEAFNVAEKKVPEGKEEELNAERERLKKIVDQRKQHRAAVKAKARVLMRKMLADTMDMIIPLTSLGWYVSEPGVVGSVMLVTSVLTSLDTWEKCRVQVEKRHQ